MRRDNRFFFVLILLLCSFRIAVVTAELQCDNPAKPRSYVRDSPLHEKLVDDTWKALNKFLDTGDNYRPRYFEGWYYKMDLSGVDGGTFVVIPGIYLRKEEPHGFVMILDATQGNEPFCRFYKFPMIDKVTSEVDGDHDFVFRLDDQNVFTAHGFTLNLPADDKNPSVVGNAEWNAPLPLPATRWNPTIMGWFSWLPRGTMQCSHGIVSMDHYVSKGVVQIGNNFEVIHLKGARGYIEKDWGREFPERYTWIQASDFTSNISNNKSAVISGASFLVSVASIPVKPFESWLEFTGFLSFLRYPNEDGTFRTIRFATYTGAKVSYTYNVTTHSDNKSRREHTVVVKMTNSQYNLTATVTGDRDGAATLWGPLPSNPSGGMRPYVREMLNCPVYVLLKRKNDGVVLFDGTAQHGGFEIEGHDEEKVII